jgi:hypothetical protein
VNDTSTENYPNSDPDRKATIDPEEQLRQIREKKKKMLETEEVESGAYEPKREDLNEVESNEEQLDLAKEEQEDIEEEYAVREGKKRAKAGKAEPTPVIDEPVKE